jgi:hypothetical protein
MFSTVLTLLADIGGGTYLGWGNFQIQLGNLIVIVVMLVLFALALVLRFPGSRRSK